MNAYDTKGMARIGQREVAITYCTHPYLDGASLYALERQRGWRAEAEATWLLKQHGILPASAESLVAIVRRSIGASLVRAGQRLVPSLPSGGSPETGAVTGMHGTAA